MSLLPPCSPAGLFLRGLGAKWRSLGSSGVLRSRQQAAAGRGMMGGVGMELPSKSIKGLFCLFPRARAIIAQSRAVGAESKDHSG